MQSPKNVFFKINFRLTVADEFVEWICFRNIIQQGPLVCHRYETPG